jgi:integrase
VSKPVTKVLLTAPAVAKFKPGKFSREIRDLGAIGHYLTIEPSGAKSFAMRFRRPNGKSGRLVLGPVDLSAREPEDKPILETRGTPLTLAASRALVAEVHRQRTFGRDVITELKAAKHRRRNAAGAADDSFPAVLREYVEKHARENVKLWRKQLRFLGLAYPADGRGPPTLVPNGLAQRWADRSVRSLAAEDISAVIKDVLERGVPGLARRPHGAKGATDPMARLFGSYLSAALGWMRRAQRIDISPSIAELLPKAGKARDRVLEDAEIIAFWNAAEGLGAPLAQLVRLLLLTGVRRSELSGMRRGELSADGAVWTVPGIRSKNTREHVVPLPPLAREILASVPAISGPTGFVFTHDGRRAVANWSSIKSRLDSAMKLPKTARPWVIHDVRRTFVTKLCELGVRTEVVEALVNHVSGARAGVAGTYNRSVLMPERQAALVRWAAHVEGLVTGRPGDVVAWPR